MRVVVALSFATTLVGLLVTEHATAFSMPCPSNRTAAFEGVVLPSSIPEIPFLPAHGFGPAPDVMLLRDVQSIAVTLAGEGLTPSEPLTPGVYTLRFPDGGCAADAGAVETRIVLGSAVPLPKHALDVSVRSSGKGVQPVQVGSGECFKEVPAAVVDLDVKPSPELEPFMPVVHFETRIDGAFWAVSDFGTIEPRSTGNSYADPGRTRPDRITQACPSDGASSGTGHHLIEVSARIGNTLVGEPARLDLEIPLASACGVAVDGTSAPTPTAGPSSAQTTATATGPGCTISRERGRLGGVAWITLGIAALARARRARARR